MMGILLSIRNLLMYSWRNISTNNAIIFVEVLFFRPFFSSVAKFFNEGKL